VKISKRGAIDPFLAMDVMRQANRREADGQSIVHMEVGQPSDPAPSGVIEAAKQALDTHAIGYTEASGLWELRDRIAKFYRDAHDKTIDSGQVMVTTGSSGGFILAFAAAFDPGDRVALACPGYPAYRNILRALDVEVVPIEVGPATHWQIPVETLASLSKPIDGLIVANPANPTGSMMTARQLREVAVWCEANDVRLISDEIYHGICYGAPAATAVGMADHAVVINSFSKYYGMTGWRIGWMVVPKDLARSVECLQQNLFISAPTLSQLAAIHAFECARDLDARVARYGKNREILLNELPLLGFDRLAPSDGAFYLYADVSHLTGDTPEFCKKMLNETGVAVTPGIDFDPIHGNKSIRFSFAGSTEQIISAIGRLKAWKR